MTLFRPDPIDKKKSEGQRTTLRVAITGASGSLGRALSAKFRSQGFFVIGLTHRPIQKESNAKGSPNEWVQWNPGEEPYWYG